MAAALTTIAGVLGSPGPQPYLPARNTVRLEPRGATRRGGDRTSAPQGVSHGSMPYWMINGACLDEAPVIHGGFVVPGASARCLASQQEQGVSGERAVVGDTAQADHRLHLGAAEPSAAQILLLGLQFRGAGGQSGGDEDVEALADYAVRAMQVPEVAQDARGQAGLLAEFFPGEVLRVVGDGHAGKRALRELPAPHPYRVAVLLHQVEPAVLDRDDQREVRLLHVRVDSGRPVRAADAVLPQAHVRRLVDHPGGCLFDDRPTVVWHPDASLRHDP